MEGERGEEAKKREREKERWREIKVEGGREGGKNEERMETYITSLLNCKKFFPKLAPLPSQATTLYIASSYTLLFSPASHFSSSSSPSLSLPPSLSPSPSSSHLALGL